MRLFIGIELPQDIKAHITHCLLPVQTPVKGWENSHDYHLTLLFIGETPPEAVDSIKTRMQDILFAPFSITLQEIVFFNRRVMYLNLADSPELYALKNALEQKFPEYINPLARPFIPHITLKRWQRYEYDELKKKIDENPFAPVSLEVKTLALFKSEKDSANRKYHVI